MVVKDPVVLASDERGDLRRGHARDDARAVDVEDFEVAEQGLVVVNLLLDVLFEVRGERRRQCVAGAGELARTTSAVSVSGTVARMIWCCWIRYSGHSSGSCGWSTSAP